MTRELVPRRAERKRLALTAQCRTQTGMRDKGTISDISAEGCCIVTNHLFVKVGAHVLIRPDGLEGLSGTVRWIEGNRAGIKFDQPLYGPVVDHLVGLHSGKSVTLSRY